MNVKDRLGWHTNEGLDKLKSLGLGWAQMTVGSPASFPQRPAFDTFLAKTSRISGIKLVVHAPFLINPATDDQKKRTRALGMLKNYLGSLARVAKQGSPIVFVVFHPGSGFSEHTVAVFQEYFNSLNGRKLPFKVLFENDAGGGNKVGSIEAVSEMRKMVPSAGFCFDTAHAWMRGDISNLDDILGVIKEHKPDLLHLNDVPFDVKHGSHRDKHNLSVGSGQLGNGLIRIARDISSPCILEMDEDNALISAGLITGSEAPVSSMKSELAKMKEQKAPDIGNETCKVCGAKAKKIHFNLPLKKFGTADFNLNTTLICDSIDCKESLNIISDELMKRWPDNFLLTYSMIHRIIKVYSKLLQGGGDVPNVGELMARIIRTLTERR